MPCVAAEHRYAWGQRVGHGAPGAGKFGPLCRLPALDEVAGHAADYARIRAQGGARGLYVVLMPVVEGVVFGYNAGDHHAHTSIAAELFFAPAVHAANVQNLLRFGQNRDTINMYVLILLFASQFDNSKER